jgi:threonine efflux protein
VVRMLHSLVIISLLHWAVLIIPGANVLVVTQLAASGHRRAACCAGLGITVVAVIWSSLALAGLHAVLDAHPFLDQGLRLLGGCYLCFLAIRIWRSKRKEGDRVAEAPSAFAAFRLGFITNILNPKAALFFGSIFATALPTKPATGLLMAVIGLIFINALAWHLLLAFAFSHPLMQDRYMQWRRPIGLLTSVILGLFGLRLIAFY